MIIILERIPEKTSENEITDFFSTVLKGNIFRKPGHIELIKTYILKDSKTHSLVYYALVFIDPDKVGARAIKKLNRKLFNGKHISVREYHLRSWHNDRRVNHQKKPSQLVCRRKGDRRLSVLKEKKFFS